MSLKIKIMIVVSIMILLSMAITMVIISSQVKVSSQKLNFAKAEEQAKHFASKVTLILEKALTTTKALEMTFRYAKEEKIARRRLDEILVESIHQNDNIFGSWMLWEPNAYDGLDDKFSNTEGHETTGRVNSYWHWHEDTIINEPNSGWETASWYNNPMQRGRETLEDPYFYQVSNEQQLLISTIQPIMIENQFHGVVGIDVDLGHLQTIVKEIKVLDSGFAELIAFNGMYIAHPNDALVGEYVSSEVKQSVQLGKLLKSMIVEPKTKRDFYQVQVPIIVGATATPWALSINVPMEAVNLPGQEVARAILLISTTSGLLMLFMLGLFIARGMEPLILITHQIKEIASATKGKIGKVSGIERGEVSTLANAFNLMVDALNESRQNLITVNNELEDRVVARTEQLEEALQQQKNIQSQLIETEKMASLGTLVAGVAHEINTPIGVALTGATHLKESTTNLQRTQQKGELKRADFDTYIESTVQICNIIEANIERATTLITNFKMVAVDKSHEEEREVKLAGYIDSVLDSLHPSFKKYRATVENTVDPQLTACCDPGALAHILTNIVMNSFIHGFHDSTQENRKISIECLLDQNMISLSVRDNGKGMSKEVKKRIFEPFYTTQRGAGGSGLGMHIIYNLVTHKLEGKVEVESEEGKGTLIKVSFPKKQMA